MRGKYSVALTKNEGGELMAIVAKEHHSSQSFRTAYVFLNCDEGKYSEKVANEQINKVLKSGMRTIDRIKKSLFKMALKPVWSGDLPLGSMIE